MIPTDEHIFAIGPVEATVLSQEQNVLQSSVTNQVFYRLYKEGTIYHSTRYNCNSKQNNTFCLFYDFRFDAQSYGQIILLALNPRPLALVSKIIVEGNSPMQQVGDISRHRSTLTAHRNADILDNFITSVKISTGSLVAVEIVNIICKAVYIICKAVYISISSKEYLSPLPDSFEYH